MKAKLLDYSIFGGFFLICLFSACGDSLPSESKVIAAINQQSIPTQNGIALSPDYTTLYVSLPVESESSSGKTRVAIYQRKWNGRAYGEPEPVNFNSNFSDYHPVMSPDGRRIYFNSTRPRPGGSEEQETVDIWYVENQGGAWSSARYLPIINTNGQDSYPTVDETGRLFFNSDRLSGDGSMDIWNAKPQGNTFQVPRPVNELNTVDSENDLTISPDGQTLIFNRYHFNARSIDLYQSSWKNGAWSDPILLDKVNERDIWELSPTIGPQGRLFLYEREGVIRAMKLSEIY